MKLSKLDQSLVNSALHLKIEYVEEDLMLRQPAGYGIQVINSCACIFLWNGGCVRTWKTHSGAVRGAASLRPDLFATGRGIS